MSLGGNARGCGAARQAGGIYIECGSKEGNLSLLELICDPVIPFDAEKFDLSPVGSKIVPMNGTFHVLDWVGAAHYPNAADFIEEALLFGISRRISRLADFDKLGPDSKILLIHPRAIISKPLPSWLAWRDWPCPTGRHSEKVDNEAGLLWQVGEPKPGDLPIGPGKWLRSNKDRVVPTVHSEEGDLYPYYVRVMPSFSYNIGAIPHDVGLSFSPGVIMVAPIERLAVVTAPSAPGLQIEAFNNASRSRIPCYLADD